MGILGYEPLETQIGESRDGSGRPSGRRDAAVVSDITPGSLGERAGLNPGDVIESINGEVIGDPIDLLFHAAEDQLNIRFKRGGRGRVVSRRLDRRHDEELGIALEDFRIRMCNNQCVFCFIHQNPPGLRKSIYFKDGDFRMSFLHGNYITMTNMSDADFERIAEQGLNPMYVSVHATDHELRLRMLGVRRGLNVLDGLGRLRAGGTQFHTQIVLCPGWNDGKQLDRTLKDLLKLRPELLSVAIVPLGMSDHREGLEKMKPTTPTFCRAAIEQIRPLQERLIERHGEPVVYLSDEFYLMAGLQPPSYAAFDVVHQLENGVGMVWEFMRPWRRMIRRLPDVIAPSRSVAVMTGLLGARVLRRMIRRLDRISGLRVDLIPCVNGLFGPSITVSGLLSGGDLRRAIAMNPGYDRYIIPGNAIRAEGCVFLDDMTFEDLNRACDGKVIAVDGDCSDLIEAVLPCSVARRSVAIENLNDEQLVGID